MPTGYKGPLKQDQIPFIAQRDALMRVLAVWAGYPELRLTQFLINAVSMEFGAVKAAEELFYITDDELIRACEKYAHNQKVENRFPPVL